MMYRFALERDELGRRLGDGITAGSITLLEGKDGAGKSVLSQRFTYGFLVNGHSVTYISTELSTRDFLNQMHSLGYDVVRFLLSRQLVFVPVFPPSVKNLKPKRDLIKRLIRSDWLFSRDITVVDSLNLMIPDGKLDEKTLFEFITFLKRVIQKKKSVILTYDPEALEYRIIEELTDIADNYLILKQEVMGDDIKNVIYVKRWRGVEKDVMKVIKFRVEPKFGIVIDISAFAI